MIHPTEDRVSLAPFRSELHAYSAGKLRLDVQAGVTVAVFAVPQAMAYAMLAGLPPVHGLYAAIVMSVVAALWGSSPFVNTGPTNTASLLTAAALMPLADPANLPALVFQFTLLVGLIRLVMGLLQLGWLVRFVPESAFLGFLVGAGVLIALGQLHHLLGVAGSEQSSFVFRIIEVLQRANGANWHSVSLGLGTLMLMLLLDRFSRSFPVALLIIGLATAVAFLLPNTGLRLVHDIAPVPSGLPALAWQGIDFSVTGELIPPALAVALIGLIEAVSIGQTLALKHRQHLNFNQEFFGQGLSHLAAAFFQGFPGSGSFSRSALIEQSGGQTRLANVYFGVLTALALLFFARWLEIIPVAALSGLLLYIGFKLLDVAKIRLVWRTSRPDAIVLALTFFVTVFVKIEYGFFAGIAAAMVFFLNRARALKLYEMVPQGRHGFEEQAYTPDSRHERSDVVALGVHGELFFGVAQTLRAQLNEIVRVQQPKHIIVRTRRAHSIDYSCWNAIFDFAQQFAEQGGRVYLSGVQAELAQVIHDARMQYLLPREQLFPHTEVPMESLHRAAREVLRHLPENAHLSPAWADYLRSVRETAAMAEEYSI